MLLFMISSASSMEFQVSEQTIVHQELTNGIDVIWIDDGSPLVDLYTVYAVGSYMDTKANLAHMTEHAMFCTTSGAFDTVIKPYSQSTNAYTRAEHTTYYTTAIPSEHLWTVLDMEYSRMESLFVDQECFDYERSRLDSELENNATILADWEKKRREYLFGTGYAGNHTETELMLSDVQAFYQQWYQPQRTAIVIVGSIGVENWNKITDRFGQLSNREDPNIVLSETKHQPFAISFGYPLSQPRREWLWRGPSIDQQQEWLYWVLLSKTLELERNSSGLGLVMNSGFNASFIEMSASENQIESVNNENDISELETLYERIQNGEIDTENYASAVASFSRQLEVLPIRGRPYFTVASHLGLWASWNHLSTLLQMIEQTKSQSTFTVNNDALSYIEMAAKIEIYNPKGEVGELPIAPKGLVDAAQMAQNSGDISRAIACYEKLLTMNADKINTVIYHYYLAILHLESGEEDRAIDHLNQGLAVVEYPALRELLTEIEQQAPQERGEAQVIVDSDKFSFDGEIPEWADQAAEVMEKIEDWRGLQFKEKVTIRFQEDAGFNAAGWYDYESKSLVVGKGGSQRFGEGVMLHELYHALQDQHFDLGQSYNSLMGQDQRKAFQAVVEGEAMLAVSELMNYDFLAHVQYESGLSKEQFKKLFEYGEGMKFVKAIRENGGWEAVGRLYLEPPKSTSTILNPQRYLSGMDSLQTLSKTINLRRGEELIEVESKGGYGWMLYLATTSPNSIHLLNQLYKEDEFIVLTRDGKLYYRWRVGFASIAAAKKAEVFLQPDDQRFSRKGRWLVWEREH
jgi:tetratricopeptide (TPR) repeat protein